MEKELTIEEFIEKYGKPYDPDNDDYDIPPFQKNIDNASKSSKIFNMHKYWTKQDPYVVKRYIEHYTEPGDIVLDAFAGTGMTGVAAILCGRNAILCDISPVCVHIAKNYTTPIDPYILQKACNELYMKIEPEIALLYRTTCHNCGNTQAQIANTILSDVFRCPRCGKEILFARGGLWERMKKGEKLKKILCDNCNYEFTKAKAEFVRYEPIEIRVKCEICNTKGEKKAKSLTEEDWELYIKIHGGPTKVIHEGDDIWSGYKFIPVEGFIDELGTMVYSKMLKNSGKDLIPPKEPSYWYPDKIKFFGDEPRRNLKRGITHPCQMFSRRNLIALSILWHYIQEIDDIKIKEKMKFVFSGMLFLVSLQSIFWPGGTGIRSGTLYISSLVNDVSILSRIRYQYNTIIQGLSIIQQSQKKDDTICTILNSATNLKTIPSNSVDYLYYDPPYGSNINYSELNIIWESWLSQFTNTNLEIIENKYQNKNRKEYEKMMLKAFQEANRVLKPKRWLTIIYSYSDPSMYSTIQNLAQKANFSNYDEILHINSKRKTSAQRDSNKVQQRYLVFNFIKSINNSNFLKESDNIELDVIKVIQEFLSKNPGMTRDYIYDQVIKRLFSSVKIEKFDLDKILKLFFRKVGDEWYAPGTLIERQKIEEIQTNLLDNKEQILEHPEKEVIIQLQEFLNKHGETPYSEIREYFMRKINIPLERELDDLLSENFIINDGRIKLPNQDERKKMQNVLAHYTIVQIRHFLEGSLKKSPSQIKICEWIEFCYGNNYFKEGWYLFNAVNKEEISEDLFKKTDKIAEICNLKIEK